MAEPFENKGLSLVRLSQKANNIIFLIYIIFEDILKIFREYLKYYGSRFVSDDIK
jgi:hypothetical protein